MIGGIFDFTYDPFPFRGGWILGCGWLALSFLVISALRWRAVPSAPFQRALSLASGLPGAVLLACGLPTVCVAVWLLAAGPRGLDPGAGEGMAVAVEELRAPAAIDRAGFVVRVTYPAGPVTAMMADRTGIYPVIVALPGNGGNRFENDSSARFLASCGYVVIAIDDVDLDPPAGRTTPNAALNFDYTSWGATLRTMRLADDKAHREARRGLDALNQLAGHPPLAIGTRLDLRRVGFWGFSFGGAASAQAALLDRRVVAVVNEDGSVFGAPARGESPEAYMALSENEAIDPARLRSSDPVTSNYAYTVLADHHLMRRLLQRADHFGYVFHGTVHENFSDRIFSPQYFRNWLVVSPLALHTERRVYLRAFFDTYLRGKPAGLLDVSFSPFGDVQPLKHDARWARSVDATPVTSSELRLFAGGDSNH